MTCKLIRPKYSTDPVIHPSSLKQMKERGGSWAAYQNHDLGSRNIGHLKFLKVGEECTYKTPPSYYPANTICEGHNYLFVGMVDLQTGNITES